MANVQYTENMTEEQLDSMAGGDTLRYLATSYGISRNNKVHIHKYMLFIDSKQILLEYRRAEIIRCTYIKGCYFFDKKWINNLTLETKYRGKHSDF